MKHATRITLAALTLLAGCASNPAPNDPLEPMNRVIYRFNTTVDRAAIKPVAQAYHNVVPGPIQTAVSNFFNNLHDVTSMVNNALQGHPDRTVNDFMRVSLDTTFGLFGLIDIADPAGLKNYKTGFGDTLAAWGWKNSSYLVLPLFGPSTVRDGIGRGTDWFTPPQRLIYSSEGQQYTATTMDFIDRRTSLLGVETAVDEAALDPYIYTRDAYLQYRAKQLGLQPPASTDTLNIDELVGDDNAAKPSASAPAGEAKPAASSPVGTTPKDASGAQ